mgnify:CR=1 FL=1
MKLSQCTTVRDSLYWMDQIVPGFWDFATKRPLPRKSVREIANKLDHQWSAFIQMYRHIHRLKTHSTWSVEDGCYSSLLDNAFSPIIAHEDLSKLVSNTKPH